MVEQGFVRFEHSRRVHPHSREELSHFLKEIRRRALLPREEWVQYREVVSLLAHPEWKWELELHQPIFDKLERRVGAYHTAPGLCLDPASNNVAAPYVVSKDLTSFLKIV
jgi:hypothetical protein